MLVRSHLNRYAFRMVEIIPVKLGREIATGSIQTDVSQLSKRQPCRRFHNAPVRLCGFEDALLVVPVAVVNNNKLAPFSWVGLPVI